MHRSKTRLSGIFRPGRGSGVTTSGQKLRQGRPIRQRLAALLAVPLAAVLALLSLVVLVLVVAFNNARATTHDVALALDVERLVQALQDERGATAGLLTGNDLIADRLDASREAVDQQRAAVTRRINEDDDPGNQLDERTQSTLASLNALENFRGQIDAGSVNLNSAVVFFTDRITSFNTIDFELDRLDDQALRRMVTVMEALRTVKEGASMESVRLNEVFLRGSFELDGVNQYVSYAGLIAEQDAAFTRFAGAATQAQRDEFARVLDTGSARTVERFREIADESADGREIFADTGLYSNAMIQYLTGVTGLQEAVADQIAERASQLQTDALNAILILVVIVAASIVAAVVLLFYASRSITRPLAALSAEADHIAEVRLPQAVALAQELSPDEERPKLAPVRLARGASAEMRAVAEAFDHVQATAYALATEQALLRKSTTESLANLGRRNQNLLRRQLGFITTLEREETDPSALANLFELDHLATRMRRNAESLLVLVGSSSPRQWSAPLPIADVIRAAVSEVEEYRRVSFRRIDEANITGAVVSGVAHLLAELIENGLTFSPPDSDVEIQGRRVGDQYLIAIVDQGVGMSDVDIEAANARLRGEGDFITAPARYLGHYVVGQLAADMGAEVKLASSPVTGVTARVLLPAAVMSNASSPVVRDVEIVEERPARPVIPPAPFTPVMAPTAPPAPPAPEVARPLVSSGAPTQAPDAPYLAIGGRVKPSVVEYLTVPPSPEVVAAEAAAEAVAEQSSPRPRTIDAEEVERTRNGLRKRAPRTSRPEAEAAPAPAPSAPETRAAMVDSSPAEVRNRLTALRAGMQRANTDVRTNPYGTEDGGTSA
ncbi:anti-sigma regulatory factor (Ser/Thr protein kinase)/HAMP domain-containing protein [Catenuloplanes nepalensis]|uniref:histidine kinase n=1 Tax=Catenuloplanes nepalensis TaxID=587533 RepID=A0ABT9MKZ3_9ACTN|nr:nitrate- and nitrite sensing domain-containing protein [Catenuloplanes nepalensis]MDP9792080.1 anti-sigma regulatory factor (Ser/Thr protein kinase)/HAMP domain-containing protein [Catenuloplanes nepalensis]